MNDSINTPKLRVPLTLGANGSFQVVEQDSIEEVEQCVEAILRTPVGSYEIEPEFGIDDPTFSLSLSDIGTALDEWEPRMAGSLDQEDLEDTIARVNVHVDKRGAN